MCYGAVIPRPGIYCFPVHFQSPRGGLIQWVSVLYRTIWFGLCGFLHKYVGGSEKSWLVLKRNPKTRDNLPGVATPVQRSRCDQRDFGGHLVHEEVHLCFPSSFQCSFKFIDTPLIDIFRQAVPYWQLFVKRNTSWSPACSCCLKFSMSCPLFCYPHCNQRRSSSIWWIVLPSTWTPPANRLYFVVLQVTIAKPSQSVIVTQIYPFGKCVARLHPFK